MFESKLIIEAIDTRIEKYKFEKKRCKQEFSREALHDFRVSTRRLLSIIELLRYANPDPEYKNIRKILKSQLTNLNSLRDTQITLADLYENSEKYPEIINFLKYLEKKEKGLLEIAEIDINKFPWHSIKNKVENIKKSLMNDSNDLEMEARLLSSIDEVFSNTKHRIKMVDPSKTSTIHSVRVMFKKFRYMVEVVHPIIDEFPESIFVQLHDYQGLMGEIQDMEVIITNIRSYESKHNTNKFENILLFYINSHQYAVGQYIQDVEKINLFWRENPDSIFPWNGEKNI